MVTPTRTSAPRKRAAASKSSATTRKRTPEPTVEKASDAITGTASGLLDAVKASPIKSAAIAAGVAGAGALIWSNRSQIAQQASVLGDKAGELGGKLGERAVVAREKLSKQATALGGKLSEQASTIGEKVSDRFVAATSDPIKTQQEIAEEALTLKQTGDPMIAEQSKVGAVSY